MNRLAKIVARLRTAPGAIGMPRSVAARRHARWAAALLLSAMVFAFGTYIMGGFSNGRAGALSAAMVLWIAFAAVGTVVGIIALWRAAALSSSLSKVASALLTAAVVVFVAGLVIPASSIMTVLFVPVGLLLAIVGTLLGAVAWAGTGGATEPAPVTVLSAASTRRLPPVLTVSLVIAGVLLAALILVISGALAGLAVFVIPGVLLLLGVLFVVRVRRTAHEAAPRRAWLTVFMTGALALAAVVVGALDLLVWSPLAQAPDYTLAEIWAALSPGDIAYGVGFAVVWIVFWAIAALVYLAGSIAVLGRAARPSTRSLASAGLLLVAATVFFQFLAGFSLGMSIADTLPPYRGLGSDVGIWYAMAGQIALVAFLVLSIAPRPVRPAIRVAA